MAFKPTNKQSAFSLVEVLIALLILAIGMLAFAAAEIMGQRGTHSALKRSHATMLANDLAERLHANPFGNYTRRLSNNDCPINVAKVCANTPANQQVPSCTPDEMANHDLAEWFCGNNSYRGGATTLLGGPGEELPVGTNIQCTDADENDQLACSPGSTYFITVSWQEREANRDQDGTNRPHGDMVGKSLEIVVVP